MSGLRDQSPLLQLVGWHDGNHLDQLNSALDGRA
jgi:hypothetical protein